MSSAVSRSARLLVIAGVASGLVTAGEGALTPDKLKRLADLVERSVDLDALLELASPLHVEPPGGASPPEPARARIGVARDSAFCFYYRDNYRDNFALLEANGSAHHYAGNPENPVFTFRLGAIRLASTGIYSLDRSLFRFVAPGATDRRLVPLRTTVGLN